MLLKAGTSDYRLFTESPKSPKSLTAWLMKSGLMGLFSLAVQYSCSIKSSFVYLIVSSFSIVSLS